MKCVQFTGQRAISQKLNDVCNKTFRLALEYVENCQSRVSFVAFSCLDSQILVQKFPNLTVHKTSPIPSLFLLAVYTHEVPLCLCSIFCSRSQVRLSTVRYRAFGVRTMPRTVSCNLKWAQKLLDTIYPFVCLTSHLQSWHCTPKRLLGSANNSNITSFMKS